MAPGAPAQTLMHIIGHSNRGGAIARGKRVIKDPKIGNVLGPIQEQLANYKRRQISLSVHPDDDMTGQDLKSPTAQYFSVGENAIEIIFEAMLLGRLSERGTTFTQVI